MLLYVFGVIMFLAATFGYANQDFLKSQDDGEKAAAAWMIGHHNAMNQSCRNALDCSSASGAVARLLPSDPTYLPSYLFKQDGNAGLWLGVQTVSFDEMLFSFYDKGLDGGTASRGRNLSLPKIAARLYEAAVDLPDGVDLWTGIYSASAHAVVVSNGFTTQSPAVGTFDDVHSQSAGVGPLAGIDASQPFVIPVDFAIGGIPIADGAPVIVSPVPCKGGKGQCLGPDAVGGGDPRSVPTPQLTTPPKTDPYVPPGSLPGVPPAPGGVWDPGLGGIGTVVTSDPAKLKPVIVTGDCLP